LLYKITTVEEKQLFQQIYNIKWYLIFFNNIILQLDFWTYEWFDVEIIAFSFEIGIKIHLHETSDILTVKLSDRVIILTEYKPIIEESIDSEKREVNFKKCWTISLISYSLYGFTMLLTITIFLFFNIIYLSRALLIFMVTLSYRIIIFSNNLSNEQK
jgi:hypothetical protein